MSPSAVLIGAPGAGKSVIGRALAERLNVDFRDTDDDIAVLAGKPVADVFIDDGEDAVRALEATALEAAISECRGVVAIGSGIPMHEEQRAQLEGLPVVWLEVTLSDAAQRLGLNGPRPAFMGNVRGQLMALLTERSPVYAALATVRVRTAGRTLPEIVDEIATALESSHG